MSTPDAPALPPLRPGARRGAARRCCCPTSPTARSTGPRSARSSARTVDAGLTPAVNMDTGFVQLLDPATRAAVLATTAEVLAGRAAGPVAPADPLPGRGVRGRPARRPVRPRPLPGRAGRGAGGGRHPGGLPVPRPQRARPRRVGRGAPRPSPPRSTGSWPSSSAQQFVPYGRIYPLDAYRGLLEIPACIGAKHSSLSRAEEWDRLALRDAVRPDFHVFTGNDLAIDMICWGSDYLLGLAAFAPDHFARRDAAWAAGDPAFHELNDRLQYLGAFSFRDPVPAYRHDAALFLHHRGWIASPTVPEGAATRPASDRRRPGPDRRRPGGGLVSERPDGPADDTDSSIDIVQVKRLKTPADLRARAGPPRRRAPRGRRRWRPTARWPDRSPIVRRLRR